MDLQIIKQEDKPLFGRKEILARITYESVTPKREEIKKELAHKLKAKEELVIVNRIFPDYGTQGAKVEARVYDDEETMKKVEYRFTLIKHGLAQKEDKKAAVPEAPKKKKK